MTMERDCECGIEAVREQAALWFSRHQDGQLDAGAQARFAAWLAEHPQHQQEFRILQRLWGATDLIPAQRLHALADATVPRRRRTLLRYAVAASLLLAVGGSALLYSQRPAGYDATFATAVGERRQIDLPDGSQVELNSRTQMAVHFEGSQRLVTLGEGEAMFSVQRDPSRPLVVRTAQGSVTVTGTRFDVRQDPTLTRVAVESGTVLVRGSQGEVGRTVTLTAGLGSQIGADGQPGAATPVNLANLTAWRSGKLAFDNATLAEVVQEVSRYREKPLRVTAKAAQLRLSSVFRTDDTDALLRALPGILPVAVRNLGDGSQEIFTR